MGLKEYVNNIGNWKQGNGQCENMGTPKEIN
jgi:hypothetical protein